MSRGWDVLAEPQNIMDYINLTIQDIYNQDSATFLWKTEELEWTLNWNYMVYQTNFPMRKVQELIPLTSDWTFYCDKLTPTLFAIKDQSEFKFDWNQIITDKSVTKISVTYVMDYEFALYPDDMTKTVPLPKRYLPSLLKLAYDWASPINLLDWEMQNIDMYSHWKTRMNELAQMDSLTDFIDVRPRN